MWWQQVDKIFYMNLDSRLDRKQHMENVFHKLKIPVDRTERVVAVKETPGWKGCAKSHIKALSLALDRGYHSVCLLEDDFTPLLPPDSFHNTITSSMFNLKFDVLMLGMTPIRLKSVKGSLCRVLQALAMPGYIVHRDYVPTLIKTFQQALQQGKPIDMLTQTLQPKDRWYGFYPSIAHQLPGYSDIENRVTDYRYLDVDCRMLQRLD